MENIILIAHGSPNEKANNMEIVAQILHSSIHPGCSKECVQVAYLQYGRPDIHQAIRDCIAGGAQRIIIHPFFLANGVHVSRDIPEIIAAAARLYPDRRFVYTEPLGVHQKIIQVVRERIDNALIAAPREIEARSFSLIEEEEDFNGVPAEQLPIVKRVIHATGDFEFKNTLRFSPGAVAAGMAAIRAGRDIITDVGMVKAGINSRALARWGGRVICRLPAADDHPDSASKRTRSQRGIEEALAPGHNAGIVAIGNAPTALRRTMEILSSRPPAAFLPLVVGVPVGFVQALEAKTLLAGQDFPFITNLSRKGGSAVAVAIVNALLIMSDGLVDARMRRT